MKFSHEAAILAKLEAAVRAISSAAVHHGQGALNTFGILEWELAPGQRFQFGYLRIEAPLVTVVVEAESGGGVTNLAKYWSHLAAGRPTKRFVLAHLFLVESKGDFIFYRLLWEFLVGRMRDDLQRYRAWLLA